MTVALTCCPIDFRTPTVYNRLCRFQKLNIFLQNIPEWPFFVCILYNLFGEGTNTVIVSGRLVNLILISEEHWKNNEILFQNVYGHRESVVLRVQVMLITYCFCDFLFHRYPCMTKENVML